MLTGFLVTCGVLLILFVVPPARWWAVANPPVGDRRPMLLALGLLTLFVAILLVSWSRAFFALAPLSPVELGIVALAGLLWVIAVRTVWRTHLLARLLGTGPTLGSHSAVRSAESAYVGETVGDGAGRRVGHERMVMRDPADTTPG
jgi:cation-transporting ATPase E